MPLGKTPILQNDTMAENDTAKYLLFNNSLVKIEDSIQRVNTVNVGSNADVSLSESVVLGFGVHFITSATAPHTLTIPAQIGTPAIAINRLFSVINDSGQTTTITHGFGATVQVPDGEGATVFADGTDIHAVAVSSSGGGTSAVPLENAGVQVQASPTALNIVGNGATATDVAGVGTITVPGTTVRVDGGIPFPSATQPPTDIEFISGTNVTMALVDNLDGTVALTMNASGGAGTAPVEKDSVEIVAVPTALNFTGTNISVTDVGGVATISVSDSASISIGPTITASRNLTNTDLTGNVFYDVDTASTVTLTVPSGLTGTEPVTFQSTGTGTVSFVAGGGVVIQSLDSNLSIAGQFGSVTLIPKGSDVYGLVGALS